MSSEAAPFDGNFTLPPEFENITWPAIFTPFAPPHEREFWNLYLLGPIGIFGLCFLWVILMIFYKLFWSRIHATCCEPTADDLKPLIINEQGYLEEAVPIPSEDDPAILEEGLDKSSTLRNHPTKYLQAKTHTFDISFTKLGLKLNSGAVVLKGVTGVIEHGKTTAIMGPSGSGKTTFLTALAGRVNYGKLMGVVKINGRPDSLTRYKKILGFVPQEDTMLRTMTVKEALMFSALTRLPSDMKYKRKEAIVDEVIELLGLKDVQNSVIGDEYTRGISGGQVKRVNIGLELVADPSILLLDEPTSGLDSAASKEVCQCLKTLASTLGITVALVLHQPRYEVFSMFDNVLLLGKGGRTVYIGPTKGVLPYFESLGFKCPEHVNPADFILDVVSGEIPREGHSKFDPNELFDIWEEHVKSQVKQSGSFAPALADAFISEPSENPELKYGYGFRKRPKMHLGSVCDFISMFIVGLIIPLGIALALYHEKKRKSLRWRYGGFLGAVTALITIFFWIPYSMLFLGPNEADNQSVVFVSASLFVMDGLFVVLFIIIVLLYNKRNNGVWLGHFIGGLVLGPIWMFGTWSHPKITPHQRYASVVGFAVFVLCVGVTFLGGNLGYPVWVFFLLSLVPLVGVVMLVVFSLRYKRLPSLDRRTPGLFYQVWLVFKRSIIHQFREWTGIIFDLGLVVAAGGFLGVIYYNREYKGPIIDLLLPNGGCPKDLIPDVCSFLQLPRDDPIAGEASLTCLSLGLAAMASSLRVFGSEKLIFTREARSGVMTEAYFLGKMLAHLPTLILAPTFFLLCYYSLKLPPAPFYEYLLLFFAVYFTCASISYFISIVVPSNYAQLAGVLVILIFMMFSGSNPTLKQLQSNPIIPGRVLYYPSFVSVFRWSQELYYLIEVAPYSPSPDTLENVFSYSMDDYWPCWAFIISLVCVFRLAAYVALVVKEDR